MATLNQFESRIGQIVRIVPTKSASNRTKNRIRERSMATDGCEVERVHASLNTGSPVFNGVPAVLFVTRNANGEIAKWWWLPLAEIEIAP